MTRKMKDMRREAVVRGERPPLRVLPPSDAVAEAQADTARRAEAAQADSEGRLRQLWTSIPAHLRDTPEAKLMVARVSTSWTVPVHPSQAKAWAREWEDFLASHPPPVSSVWTPPADGTPRLWVPGQP